MIDTTHIWSDMAARWTTAFLITAIFGGSAFICESRKQAFGMVVLLASVAFFEIVHAVVKRFLFPSPDDPRNVAKDQPQESVDADPGTDTSKRIRKPKGYAVFPVKYLDNPQNKPSMGTQTTNMDSFHDAMDHFTVSSTNKVILQKKVSSHSKKTNKAAKRALAIERAKKSMAEDKKKVEAIKKRMAAESRRA